ncbi:hypothetical protein [Phenylobacterium sp.]|uniref:hypothetical protein n=1 Tax=Phenylobacterium sp. TaxID=1871053 RepID=UPI002DF4F024|nr:hypothetical protein [Phenylobacterium sp.]
MAVGNSEVDVENLKGAIALGQQVLKSLELANGGAVVAILTFYGNLAKTSQPAAIDRAWIGRALIVFAVGLALALGAAACAYLGQVTVATAEPDGPLSLAERNAYIAPKHRLSNRLLKAAVVVALASLLAFVLGAAFSAVAFA